MTLACHHPPALVLSLAIAASLLELGPLIALLHVEKDLLDFLVAGLAYQVGNAAPHPTALSGRYTIGIITLTAAALLIVMPAGTVAWYSAIALMSWSLQIVRRNVTAHFTVGLPTTAQKRAARVLGFIAAALVPPIVWLTGVVVTIGVGVFGMNSAKRATPPAERGFGHPLEWTMLVHQTHYFCYAYAVPLLVASAELGGPTFVGFWFASGWVSYLSAESLWRRWPPKRVFVLGHLFLACVLLVMSMTATPWMTLLLWGLSGLGGGTVYCLTLMHKREGLAHERLERAEDAGHLLGVAVAIASVKFLGWNAILLPAAGSIWAAAAAIAMIFMCSLAGRKNSRAQ